MFSRDRSPYLTGILALFLSGA
ncbi:MAG: hypothetical protein QOE54_3334, partial [Streptosporangiaceae bacterium]|nr:hypothetical protein [Streptosporangiaceae bacterium]